MMADEKKPTLGRPPSWVWWLPGILVFLSLLAFCSGGDNKAAKQQQAAATAQPAPLQQWQLCWEKKPEAKGTINVRSQCFPAKVSRDRNSVVLAYQYNDRQGTMEASSSDGLVYDGLWKDPGGWGNFHLRFTSPTSAVGWVDEKGEKPINLWLSPK